MEPPATTCVSNCISWDSAYREVIDDRTATSGIPSVERRAHTMRMPSVIVSDCSEEPADNHNNLAKVAPRREQSILSSSTVIVRKLTSEDEFAGEAGKAWPSWPAGLGTNCTDSSFAPGRTSPPGDELVINNLLSVRRLSDCSSSSSLATLDMEPYCSSNANEAISDTFEAQNESLDTEFSSNEDVAAHDDKESASSESPESECPHKTVNSKISAWRKVRSAVQWSPFVQTFRKQRYPWVQLAGHQGNFKAGGESGTILKKLCPREESCFQLLMDDPLRPFIPSYKGNVSADDGEKFLVLEDLLGEFNNPNVMDCKLGVRTYLEEELAKAKLKPKLRKDMFEKMLQIDPDAPTAEEIRLGGVTKPRYMVWRETISSTATLGFRIEGIRKQDGSSSKDFKTVGTSSQILSVLREFIKDQPQALKKYIQRLEHLDATLAISQFFANHELIGSSLLFVHDKSEANVWMIDFAKTNQVPEGITIDHRTPWCVGNHEDGYLIGLHNLIASFKQLLQEQNDTCLRNGLQDEV